MIEEEIITGDSTWNASISSGVRAAETLGLPTGAVALTALDEMIEMDELQRAAPFEELLHP